MMLEHREAAKILEDIVGTDNFSEDPAIISSYTFMGLGIPGYGSDLFDLSGLGAVILPGSTEEVQAIVRTCNKYKIRFKAISTGLNARGLPAGENPLQLDMRRMNRIIEWETTIMHYTILHKV